MLDLRIHNQSDIPIDSRQLRRLIEATFAQQNARLPAVSVSFVDAETIRQLNRQHRGIDQPTDVLSYPYDDSFPTGAGGELVLCPEIARRQVSRTHRLEDELAILVVHGTLHLLGYEDATEHGQQVMQQHTTEILQGVASG